MVDTHFIDYLTSVSKMHANVVCFSCGKVTISLHRPVNRNTLIEHSFYFECYIRLYSKQCIFTTGTFYECINHPIPSDNGTISLESVQHRTQHVGITPEGHVKPANETGTGKHGQFYPILVRYSVLYIKV